MLNNYYLKFKIDHKFYKNNEALILAISMLIGSYKYV